jgi:hypothetical protein
MASGWIAGRGRSNRDPLVVRVGALVDCSSVRVGGQSVLVDKGTLARQSQPSTPITTRRVSFEVALFAFGFVGQRPSSS